jgi:hypothetical protein
MNGLLKNIHILFFTVVVSLVIGIVASHESMFGLLEIVEAAESQFRTESNCTIGMVKGDTQTECQVPILSGCTVAQFPGYDEPWAEASKGGATSCKFNEKKTDWKTAIVGTCQACKTAQCTGRFTVMFNCVDNVPPANQATPQRK